MDPVILILLVISAYICAALVFAVGYTIFTESFSKVLRTVLRLFRRKY